MKIIRKPIERPPLDRYRFDALLSGPEKIWGLEAIAKTLGISVSTARRMAKRADVPISKPDGSRHFALRSELLSWAKCR
jgi:hypothetical protein